MMMRFVLAGCVLVVSTLSATASDTSLDDRMLPMQFELRREGPAQACGKDCRIWISAMGAITADTPRDFEAFARGRDLRGVVMALDSDGGSVVGALALGRAIRKLGMSTTVGETIEVNSSEAKDKRAALRPRAYCGSMCTLVLLAGVERHVPPEARVLVHQIWLGDRRDDPTAATYSAEDLVLVQRDIGQIAHYAMEMAGTSDLLTVMLKIPPWEPMHELSPNQLREMKLVTADDRGAVKKISSMRAASQAPQVANGNRATASALGWTVNDKDGPLSLARRHPLTVYGDDIGSFDLSLQCGTAADHYIMSYAETRRATDKRRLPEPLREVELMLGGKTVALKVVSSQPSGRAGGRESLASGPVPVALVKNFATPLKQSLTVETSSHDATSTIITIGNAGLARNFSQLVASCNAQSQLRNAASQNSTETAAIAPSASDTAAGAGR